MQWQGVKYHTGDFIWCGYQEELSCFGKLSEIIVIESKIFFAYIMSLFYQKN